MADRAGGRRSGVGRARPEVDAGTPRKRSRVGEGARSPTLTYASCGSGDEAGLRTIMLAVALHMLASPVGAVANHVPLALPRGIGLRSTAENNAGLVKPAWSRSERRAE